MQKISRRTRYGDLVYGGTTVVSWLASDAIFPSEIIALRPMKKLPGPPEVGVGRLDASQTRSIAWRELG